jgi:hypothetical protein
MSNKKLALFMGDHPCFFAKKRRFAKFGNFFIFSVPSLTFGPRNWDEVMEMVTSRFIE